jgi:photosystem II stability/assembly factor-like uncharacterized protein
MAADSSGNLYAVIGSSFSNSAIYMMEKGSGRWTSKAVLQLGIQDLASTPDGMLIAGTEGAGVIRSTDHGATWQPSPGFDNGFVWAISALPDGSVAAGGQFGDVSVSPDSGRSWTRIAEMPNQVFIMSIVMGPGGDLFVGSTDSGLYQVTVSGGSGVVSRVGLNGGVGALRIVAGGDLIAGEADGKIYRIRKSGGSWSVTASDSLDGWVNSIEQGPGGALVAATVGGLYVAEPGGFTWLRLDLQSSPPTIGKLVIEPEGDLYAGTLDGVFHASRLDGTAITFNPVNAGLTGQQISSVAPAGIGTYVVGTMSSGIYRTTDNGVSWSSVATLPAAPGRSTYDGVNAMTAKGSEIYASGYGAGIYRSVDGGVSWSARNGGLPNLLTIGITVDSAGGLIASLVSDGLYRSTNGGESWGKLDVGADYIPAISVAPNGNIVAGAGQAIIRSTDNGATWSNVRQASSIVRAIVADADGEIFYGIFSLSGDNGGVYRIGTNTAITKLGSPKGTVNALLRDADGRLYVGADSGAYTIAPGATTATPINDGLTISTVMSLAFGSDGRSIVAGTTGATFVATLAPSSVDEEDAVAGNALGSAAPNPVSGAASLSFTLASRERVTLDVHDVAGNLVTTLFSADASAGEHRVTWDAEGMPNGVYLIRLRGNGWSRGGTVVVAR